MNKIKYKADVFSKHNQLTLSKLALAIGLTFSVSTAWADCYDGNIQGIQKCEPIAGDSDVTSTMIGQGNTIIVYGPPGSDVFSAITSIGNATLNIGGSINMVNDQGGHGLYAEGHATTGQATINVDGTHYVQINGNAGKVGIKATSGIASLVTIQNQLHIANTSTAADSHGIAVIASAGDSTLHHQGQGTISTMGGDAINMKADGSIDVELNSGITLSTTGDNYSGIAALADLSSANNSNIKISTQASMDIDGNNAHGIFASSNAVSGDVKVDMQNATLNLAGQNSNGISVGSTNTTGSAVNLTVKTQGGAINLNNAGTASTTGNYGITAVHRNGIATGDITITNNGTAITTGLAANTGAAIHGAFKGDVASSGNVIIENRGELSTRGQNVYAIHGENVGTGNVEITSTKNITTSDAHAIFAIANSGNATVKASGNITIGQATASNHNYGIQALSQSGNSDVTFENGTIKVVGHANSGGSAIGIMARDGGSSASTSATINLGAGAVVDASEGVGALHLATNGIGKIDIANGAKVYGGHNNAATDRGYAIGLDATNGTTAAQFEINNAGLIDALSDHLVSGSAAVDSTLIIRNSSTGVMNGYLVLDNIHSTVINEGVWNVRHFADTTGDGNRNQKAVSISDFGTGADVVINEATGVINLAAIGSTTRATVDHDTSNLGYQTSGALDISHSGIVQGHLVNITRFENRGTIYLNENNLAGDVLAITGNASVSNTAGSSIFTTNGGSISLDTVLNEGGTNSLSDLLVVDHVEAGAQKTQLLINHVDGSGALTEGDGIKVVEVLGTAESGSFELGNVVRAGLYEYTLYEGSQTVAGDDSLFLRSSRAQINPDVGSYLINQAAATNLFMHTLHDRLGEPQYYENYAHEENGIPAMWIRAVSGHTKNEAAGGRLKQHSVDTLLHLGGEIANWTSESNARYHLGVMGAYGRSEGKTTSKITGSRVDSTVDGYGVGAYLTWFDKPASVEGWYGDLWTMYNWFENETDGSDKYDSKSWTVSLEGGYAFKLKSLENYHWMLEPQGQVAYHRYDVDKIKDHNGLDIVNHDKNSLTTRLGVRTYLRPNEFYKNSAQPFLELNWWGADNKHSLMFNGEKVSNDTPRNRFEVKVGVQGEMTQNLQIYSHIGMQWGKNSYEHTEGQLGVRYRF